MTVTTDFVGANAHILSVDEESGTVRFAPDLRDSTEEWFYWAFCVKGAQGRTLTFDMSPKRFVGYFGAAVSRDLYRWEWSQSASGDLTSFTYTFGEDEDCVYFAHDMLYLPARFDAFCRTHALTWESVCPDRYGTPIPCVTLGEGPRTVLLTARHHCCEATGSYVMEGILDEYLKAPDEDLRVIALPFIDADGVVRGDQGKARAPHDHNRDYAEGLYPGVRAVKAIADREKPIAAFDLHSPWHLGGRNDKIFIVRKHPQMAEDLRLFGRCFTEAITPQAMRYDIKDDIDPGVEWNTCDPQRLTFSGYCGANPETLLVFSLETTYFGEEGNVVTQEKLVETGRCFWRAFRAFREKKHLI